MITRLNEPVAPTGTDCMIFLGVEPSNSKPRPGLDLAGLSTWPFKIARNLIIDHRRSRRNNVSAPPHPPPGAAARGRGRNQHRSSRLLLRRTSQKSPFSPERNQGKLSMVAPDSIRGHYEVSDQLDLCEPVDRMLSRT